MGRKDASSFQCTPTDQYRKQIGKQDWKKSKKEIKLMKNKADQPEMSPQHIVLMLGLCVCVLSIAYLFLFWYLGAAPMHQIQDQPPV